MAKVSAKVTGGTPVEVDFNIPADLDGLVAAYGASVVYGKAVDAITIDVQALIRRHLKGTEKVPAKSAEEIQKLVSAYKPGVGAVRKSPVDKVSALFAGMSAEDKKALLATLKA